VRGAQTLASPGCFALISLDEVGGFAVAELAPDLAGALVDQLAGGPGESSAPLPLSEAEEAGTSLILLDVLTALRGSPADKALGPRLARLVHSAAEVSAATDLRAPHLALRIRVTCGPVSGLVRVLIPATALRFWLESAPPTHAAIATEVAAASLEFTVRGGRAQLAPTDLAQLTPGDVVLFEGLTAAAPIALGTAVVANRSVAIEGALIPEGFRVAGLLRKAPDMNAMNENSKPLDLPVDVEVELGKVKLSIAELGAISPGSVIPLAIRAGEPVALKVGDSTVAIAELVDIDGELGARILRLCK
jgi:type III secretion protein Q